MNPSVINQILYQLEACQAESLLVVNIDLPEDVSDWAKKNKCAITFIGASHHFDSLGRFDFIIIANHIDALDKKQSIQQLAKLRNAHSSKIWVEVKESSPLSFNDFIGLGFKRLHIVNENTILEKTASENTTLESTEPENKTSYFGFDLASYNRKRSWNSPQYWANPENWNKNRW